jgi:hypothetical protein
MRLLQDDEGLFVLARGVQRERETGVLLSSWRLFGETL